MLDDAASNPDPEICPLDGSYTLRGLISPLYGSSSRHKRNHNSKHNNHHHLHDLSLDGSSSSIISSSVNSITNDNFKAHTSLSFRNEEDSLKSWHLNDRNKSLRQRRSIQNENEHPISNESDMSEKSNEIAVIGAFTDVSDDGSDVADINDDHDVIKLIRNKRNNNDNNNNKVSNAGGVASDDGMKGNSNDPPRSRRDTTINCGSNVNTKPRQLNIGCSDENKIDVSPQCSSSDDMEEGKGTKKIYRTFFLFIYFTIFHILPKMLPFSLYAIVVVSSEESKQNGRKVTAK